jgi:hypothetical protein
MNFLGVIWLINSKPGKKKTNSWIQFELGDSMTEQDLMKEA